MNLQADPTLAAVMQKKVKKRKEELKRKREENILSTYGEQNKYKAPDRSLLFGETEQEVRYTKDGRIKGSTWCSSAKRENFNHIPQILRISPYHSLVSLHIQELRVVLLPISLNCTLECYENT